MSRVKKGCLIMAITKNQTALITRAQFNKNYEFCALKSFSLLINCGTTSKASPTIP